MLLAFAGLMPALCSAQLAGTTTLTDAAGTISQTVGGTTNSLLGATAVLGGTGTLVAGTSDALQASDISGGIANLVTGEALHATTIGYPDQIDSEASLAALNLNLAGTGIAADFVMAQATAAIGSGTSAASNIANLVVNGVPVSVTGAPNQSVGIPGGLLLLNEQKTLSDGTMVVNALHAVVSGVADVVIGTAMAGYSGGSASAIQASY